LFGNKTTKFNKTAEACQVLVAMNILAKLSFWIKKPFKTSIIDSLHQFKKQGYVEKLKAQITPEAMPTKHSALFQFLYDQLINI